MWVIVHQLLILGIMSYFLSISSISLGAWYIGLAQ